MLARTHTHTHTLTHAREHMHTCANTHARARGHAHAHGTGTRTLVGTLVHPDSAHLVMTQGSVLIERSGPWLLRRLDENADALGAAADERPLLRRELSRRFNSLEYGFGVQRNILDAKQGLTDWAGRRKAG